MSGQTQSRPSIRQTRHRNGSFSRRLTQSLRRSKELQRFERAREISGTGAERDDPLARGRVFERDRARVEREAIKAVARAVVPVDRARAVVHVADDRMADVMEVTPDLVQPPGLGLREHEGAAVDGRPAEATKARHRRDALAPFAPGIG